jgi:hypothetical protein
MGFLSKSSVMHRSERRERVERKVNGNPMTANPGEPPKPPVEPDIKNCIPDVVDTKNDAIIGGVLGGLAGLLGGPAGSAAGALMGASFGASAPMITSAYKAKTCNEKEQKQYQKDLEDYHRAKNEYDAQKNRYDQAFDEGRKQLRRQMRPKFGGDSTEDRKPAYRRTPGGTGASNPHNSGFPKTGKSPTRAPMPSSNHPGVSNQAPAYHPPNPLEFNFMTERPASVTQYQEKQKSSFRFESFAEKCERTRPRFR